MSVKQLEMPAYDPRGMKAQGLAYATSNRGGCHLRANMLGPEILGVPKMVDRFATLGKAGLLINLQNLNAVLDSLSVCKFTAFAMKEDYYARQLSAVWGEHGGAAGAAAARRAHLERRAALQPRGRLHARRRHAAAPAPARAGAGRAVQGPGSRLAADARRVLHLARLGRGRRALGRQARAPRPDRDGRGGRRRRRPSAAPPRRGTAAP